MVTECMAEDKHLSGWSVTQHYITLHYFISAWSYFKNNTKWKEAKLQKNEQSWS